MTQDWQRSRFTGRCTVCWNWWEDGLRTGSGVLSHQAKALYPYAAALGRAHNSLWKIQSILRRYLSGGSLKTRLGRIELERRKPASQRWWQVRAIEMARKGCYQSDRERRHISRRVWSDFLLPCLTVLCGCSLLPPLSFPVLCPWST